ncbi:MAG: putative toxin-antitoxin system toxin component, PIN family [Bacteroidetes bacterium]|nr:putative toxin-antitoxin system toxin component, PIN family [Bacteroidota bacterium]MBL7104771.1 putative toxin-antitoxin system toxin component, PIN family [Bacteroidales bacterium]
MKIVLDTNALLISIPKKSKFRLIFDALINKTYTLIISNEILTEYFEIIDQKANYTVASNIIEMLLSLENVEKKEVYYKWDLIQIDKDDNKFIDCAIAGNADFIVSNDHHFNVLRKISFPSISVISINEFLDILKNEIQA